jgi:hypothetical protein
MLLTLALGIPGAIAICVGIPVATALFLRAHRSKLKTPKFASTYALAYAE